MTNLGNKRYRQFWLYDCVLICSEKTIAPLYKETAYNSEETPAVFNMLLAAENANTDSPLYGFLH
jgi:hypothetical protein